MCRSDPQMPHAATFTSSSPGPGLLIGVSIISAPNAARVFAIAFILMPLAFSIRLRERVRQSAWHTMPTAAYDAGHAPAAGGVRGVPSLWSIHDVKIRKEKLFAGPFPEGKGRAARLSLFDSRQSCGEGLGLRWLRCELYSQCRSGTPRYRIRGRIRRLFAYCSSACAIHPAHRPTAKIAAGDPGGKPSIRVQTVK